MKAIDNLGLRPGRHTQTDTKLVSKFAFIALMFGWVSLLMTLGGGPSNVGSGMLRADVGAGLLWSVACSAVGCFLGFIFGIPRTLSSDTARTTVPVRESTVERATAKFKDARRQADFARREKDEAMRGQLEAAGERKEEADQVLQEKDKAAKAADEELKKAQDELAALDQAGETTSRTHDGRGPSTAINTNLEQISDWLTKIIVGVSLVNSEQVGMAMWKVAVQIGLSMGPGENKTSLALAIMVYFGVVGLLGGYLLTRLFLQPAFNAASELGNSAEGP